MKHLFQTVALTLLGVGLIFCSCKKERICEGCQINQPTNNTNKPPIALAGPDKVTTVPTDSIELNGSASNDPDGSIAAWQWTKIAGPLSFVIVNPNSLKTTVNKLAKGVYQFELKVTDNGGLSAKDTVQVNVSNPPVANAGTDQTITLPTNAVILDGGASTDPDNNVSNYLWTKISGPSSFNIVNANSVQAQTTNLAEGVYQFELTVTDSLGFFDKDTTTITVNKTYANEKIFSDQRWGFNYFAMIIIPDLYSHLPAGISFKVFIKRDNTNTWEEVAAVSDNYKYVYDIDYNGNLWIIETSGGGVENDTPDIKIVY